MKGKERDKEIACEECGTICDKSDLTEIDGNWYCDDCITTCEDCQESMIYGSEYCIDDYIYCESCYDNNTFTCDWCSSVEHIDNKHSDDVDTELCANCYEDSYACAECGNFMHSDDIYMAEDYIYCESCFYDNFSYCEDCGETTGRENLYDGYCDWCREDMQCNGIIKDYMYKPEPVFFGKSNLYFGIELEIEHVEGYKENADMAEELEHDSLYFKEDGSLSDGFEIVTHPMSYQYLKEQKEFFAGIFNALISDGYRSYNTNTCGIHIHLSKKAFSTIHLYKFLKMFYDPKHFDFIKTISQRDCDTTRGCCQWGRDNEHIDNSKVINKAKVKRGGDRYTAVNISNRDTIEIRIFRGTLKIESFYKNIEFIMAVYNYTLECSINNTTPKHFINYVSNNRKSYKNLYSFIVRRFPV